MRHEKSSQQVAAVTHLATSHENRRHLDLSHTHAVKVLPKQCPHLRLIQIGCGGIGAFLGIHVARLARECLRLFDTVTVSFYDGDTVEEKNLRRQNFCAAEVGQNKAEALAFRLSTAWGIPIHAYSRHFSEEGFQSEYHTLTILLGCVDTTKARRSLHKALVHGNARNDSQTWLIDGGNLTTHGQVLIGNVVTDFNPQQSFLFGNVCQSLPAPALVHPELIRRERRPVSTPQRSCAELAQADPQSLTINSIIASHMADYLLRLIITNDLRRFATYIDMDTGSARSLAITPTELVRVLGLPPALSADRSS
ncbi:MAG TPA: ThiF family adenylyltransferase [Nitrospira sp.]|jgi:PRTRC genetic system ThiF family protein|nr:ThiF family adenylyltransferase [Nitrospira sp.]HMZ56135.1 ThiF family adenylyltransferase [Nitrospira sp.]HNA27599.1 ThiF family adenylyltransferase [Nitrospira sp.]HNM19777.1 ThiF family adenylyltransferase [Nitrospira sp.]HNN43661.1 ThiF family adenylyltransferase [Nitrospira sp.]